MGVLHLMNWYLCAAAARAIVRTLQRETFGSRGSADLLADNLPNYIVDQQSTVNADIVVWYTGSVHHENNERDEDDNTTPVRWTGFELHPKNLFDRTPFFTP
jgi:Cu2+-containing amine oxidase